MTDYYALKTALNLAREAHNGQLDKGGDEYIFHPIIVALQCDSIQEKTVALLHDVIEDNNIGITADTVRDLGFSDDIIDALLLLTHDKNVPYENYIQAIADSHNLIAARVKLADLTMNMDSDRNHGHKPPKYDKYVQAFEKLSALFET